MGWQDVTIRSGVGDVRQIRNTTCILLEVAIYSSQTWRLQLNYLCSGLCPLLRSVTIWKGSPYPAPSRRVRPCVLTRRSIRGLNFARHLRRLAVRTSCKRYGTLKIDCCIPVLADSNNLRSIVVYRFYRIAIILKREDQKRRLSHSGYIKPECYPHTRFYNI